jgi:hypothetical protein
VRPKCPPLSVSEIPQTVKGRLGPFSPAGRVAVPHAFASARMIQWPGSRHPSPLFRCM